MRLVLDQDPRVYTVRRYDAGEIVVGEQHIARPCVVSAHALVLDWPARSVATLSLPELEAVLTLEPLIVLLGSVVAEWPPATVRRALEGRGIALECMNLGAACRTYNVLVSEGRPAVAGLFPHRSEGK
jgi:uncharacterized protein